MWSAIQNEIVQFLGGKAPGDMDFLEGVLYLINRSGPAYLVGARDTLIIAVVSTIIGCLIGLVVGILQTIPVSKRDGAVKRFFVKLLRGVLLVYVEVFRGTPMMIQASVIFYGAAFLMNYHMDLWFAAIFIVSINTGAYMAETVRGGILSIDPGQTEGAKAIGMTHVQTMVNVILPQTMRNIMPQIGNNLIINVKDTCVLSVIGVSELFFAHKGVTGATYMFFQSSVITMLIYLTMTFILSRILRLVEKKMDGSDSYDLATTDTLAHTTGMYSFPGKGSNFDERNIEYQEPGAAETGERRRKDEPDSGD